MKAQVPDADKPYAYSDFYQVHWYDWEKGDGYDFSPWENRGPSFYNDDDNPVIIGEMPAMDDNYFTEDAPAVTACGSLQPADSRSGGPSGVPPSAARDPPTPPRNAMPTPSSSAFEEAAADVRAGAPADESALRLLQQTTPAERLDLLDGLPRPHGPRRHLGHRAGAQRIGEAIGKEVRAQGGDFFAGVCVNLPRHPAWGRIQEAYGEDPLLLGAMGAVLTRVCAAT
ncbi:hypothetical protein [Streptomyces sp. NPDC021224]|uniref:hypothetical protein n=1 Tax=unclassified Streptomyces TaxID=2593676 RepID=UPI003789D19D